MTQMKTPNETSVTRNDVIELAEETATVRKEAVVTGGVRVETRTETTTQMVPVKLDRHEVEVRHIPIGKVIDKMPNIREENGVTIIPVVHERPVMRTELVLVEEVHILRSHSAEDVEVPVELRKQHAIETRLDADLNPSTDER